MCIDFLEESESYVVVILDMSTKGMYVEITIWFIARQTVE